MNSDIKPDFAKLADEWYIDWYNHHKGKKEMSIDMMNKIWTDHVEPLLSTVKRLQEENEQLISEYQSLVERIQNEKDIKSYQDYLKSSELNKEEQ